MKRVRRRRMHSFKPRIGRRTKLNQKQQLADLEHRLSMDLGAFLVLIGEGTHPQISEARIKARTELIKYGPDMQKIAQEIGGSFPKDVQEFLDSLDNILHSAEGWVDEAKISHYYNVSQKLEKHLQLYKVA